MNQFPDHERFMRQCFDLAIAAGEKGNHTFGALLVFEGEVILTSENTVNTDNDNSRHAELSLMVAAHRKLPKQVIEQCTVYTSTAPCMMCSAMILFMGVKKVVYGVSYEAFARLSKSSSKRVPCDELYRLAETPLVWIGPVLEEEGLKVFSHWPHRDSFSSVFRKNNY